MRRADQRGSERREFRIRLPFANWMVILRADGTRPRRAGSTTRQVDLTHYTARRSLSRPSRLVRLRWASPGLEGPYPKEGAMRNRLSRLVVLIVVMVASLLARASSSFAQAEPAKCDGDITIVRV